MGWLAGMLASQTTGIGLLVGQTVGVHAGRQVCWLVGQRAGIGRQVCLSVKQLG